MKSRPQILFVLLLVVAGLLVTLEARRCAAGSVRLQSARASLFDLRTQAYEIIQLRGHRERIAERKKPEQDLIARVHAVLQDANIPVQKHFQSLRPDADAALADRPGYRRQSVSVSLGKLTLPQVGAFLIGWRNSQPLWSVSRIELQHDRDQATADRYSLTLTLSAIYLDPNGGSSS